MWSMRSGVSVVVALTPSRSLAGPGFSLGCRDEHPLDVEHAPGRRLVRIAKQAA
jgi:hypothetical protein